MMLTFEAPVPLKYSALLAGRKNPVVLVAAVPASLIRTQASPSVEIRSTREAVAVLVAALPEIVRFWIEPIPSAGMACP
jgi:hypothetical protein